MNEILTITQVTKMYGISTRTLRYYEQIGLITSTRLDGYAYRVYDSKTCTRLNQILILRKLRIPLKQIALLLSDNSVIGALSMLIQHINDLDDEIATLSSIRNILQTFAERLRENPGISLSADMLRDERLLSIFSPLSLIKSNFKEENTLVNTQQNEKMFTNTEADCNPAEEIGIPDDVSKLLTLDPILLLFSSDLIPLVDKSQGGDLIERVVSIRRQLAMEKGVIIPIVRLRDDIMLKPSQYTILIKGKEAARGEIIMGHYMAIPHDKNTKNISAEDIEGIETVEPCWNNPAFWIPDSKRKRADELDCAIVEPSAVLAAHLTEVIRSHLHVLLTLEDVQKLIEHVKEDNPTLIDELIPNHMSLNNVKQVLTKLLKDGVSILDMVTILETLLDYAPSIQDTDKLAKYVQQKLNNLIFDNE